ncbi:MAG: hypothetical protein WDO74_17685 [Pseudomonadota bacterium]
MNTIHALARGFAVCGCALLTVACADHEESCPEPHTYHLYVSANSAPGATCALTLVGPRSEATYDFPALPPCTDNDQQPACATAGDSPKPASCKVWACGLLLDFSGTSGAALVDYLGATEFTLTARCDGEVLESRPITPSTGCAR